jgi:hypothetical protein
MNPRASILLWPLICCPGACDRSTEGGVHPSALSGQQSAPAAVGSQRFPGEAQIKGSGFPAQTERGPKLAPCPELPQRDELLSFVGIEIPGRYWFDARVDLATGSWTPRRPIRTLHHHRSRLQLSEVDDLSELPHSSAQLPRLVVDIIKVDSTKIANQYSWVSVYHARVVRACDASAETIGVARLEPNGTIVLQLRVTADDGTVGDSLLRVSQADPRHLEIQRHVGFLKPGESVLVRPWPESPSDPAE